MGRKQPNPGTKRNSKKPLFKKSVGGSDYHWNNNHHGTSRTVTCELCGTKHKKLDFDTTRTLDIFLGQQLVEDCCGKLIDILYEEYKRVFFDRFIKEFELNPLAYPFLVAKINAAVKEVNKKAKELVNNTDMDISLKPK